jgi:hypothetical protein
MFIYGFSAIVILGGLVLLIYGPEADTERSQDPRPVTPRERFFARAAGLGCICLGVFLIIASLFGFLPKGDPGPVGP